MQSMQLQVVLVQQRLLQFHQQLQAVLVLLHLHLCLVHQIFTQVL